MAAREPKSRTMTTIEIVGRTGGVKGRLEISSGNFVYFRPNSQTEDLRLTHQQMLSLLEDRIEYDSLGSRQMRPLNNRTRQDFYFEVFDEDGLLYNSNPSNISKCPAHYTGLGSYQLDHSTMIGKKSRYFTCCAQVSIQLAVWIIDKYIDNHLINRKMTNYIDDDVVVSKIDLRACYTI